MKKKLVGSLLFGVLVLGGLNSCGGHIHEFTVQNTDASYLVSPADCDSKAVYNYSCECGEKGMETFQYGNALSHDFVNSPYLFDEFQHWQKCGRTNCDATTSKENHLGGEATETEKAVCETCNQEYGEYAQHQHVSTSTHYEFKEGNLYLIGDCTCGELNELVDTTKAIDVSSERDLKTIVSGGFDVRLTSDIELTEQLVIDGVEIEIDLNNKTIKGVWSENNKGNVLIQAVNQAHLSIVSEGTLTADNDCVEKLICAIGSTIEIYDGNFILNNHYELIYAQNDETNAHDSVINIYGGFYKAGISNDGIYFTLNLDENDILDQSKFVVTGGEFYNFNPSSVNVNNDIVSFIDNEIYHVSENDDTYIVSQHIKTTIMKADEYQHWFACEGCLYQFDKETHSFNSEYDEVNHYEECSTCGYIANEVEHNFTTKYDENSHYEECTCGSKININNHEFITMKNNEQHYEGCECGYTHEYENHSYTTTYDYNVKKEM